MKKKSLGIVSPDERDEIQRLFNRKNGLIELSKTFSQSANTVLENDSLYEKVIEDLGKTTTDFNNWWKEMSEKYSWNGGKNYHWEIDFSTREVFLIQEETNTHGE